MNRTLEERVRDLEEYNNQQDMRIDALERIASDVEKRLRRIETALYMATGVCAVAQILVYHFLKK